MCDMSSKLLVGTCTQTLLASMFLDLETHFNNRELPAVHGHLLFIRSSFSALGHFLQLKPVTLVAFFLAPICAVAGFSAIKNLMERDETTGKHK